MARKPWIVTGNGRRSTPLTERKLESRRRSWEDNHSPHDLCTNRTTAVHTMKEGGQRRKRTGISYEQESLKGPKEALWRRPCEHEEKENVGLSSRLVPFFIFLSLSSLLELRAETVRGIKLTSPTCWRSPEFLSRRPVKTFCS